MGEALAQDKADPRSLQRETTGLTAVPREACRRAGISPQYTLLLDGEDAIKYILSANIHRRNLTKGQRAMVVARLLETSKVTQQIASKQANMSQQRISQARTVVRHAPDLAASVLAGHLSLDNAYEEARIRKGRAETYESRFNALKAAAPDLADMVTDGPLNLEEAHAWEVFQRPCRKGAKQGVSRRCLA